MTFFSLLSAAWAATPLPVVGGEPAPPGRWPDAAALYNLAGDFACTGVLVAPDVVLTAGHCASGLSHVVVGRTDLTADDGEVVDIAEVTAHPRPFQTYDVAVVVLAQPITTIVPRALALDCVVEDDLRVGAVVHIVGYGALDPLGLEWGTTLQQAATTVRDPACSDPVEGCNEEVSPGGELIAGGGGVDSCSGDSGGPLYLSVPEADYLVGLTSRAALPTETPCGGGGIYVRLDAISDWVEAETAVTLPRPSCVGRNQAPRPTAPLLVAPRSALGVVRVDPGDPDPDDTHTFALGSRPDSGTARVFAEGTITWTGAEATSFEVVVTDQDGKQGIALIEARPTPLPLVIQGSGACQTAPHGPVGVLLALCLLRRRRSDLRAAAARRL